MKNEILDQPLLMDKALVAFKLVSIGTPLLLFIEKYVFSDWDYLISLMLLVGLNTIVGSLAAGILGQFSAKLFYKKLGIKIFGIAVVLIGVGILKKAKIDGEDNYLSTILDAGMYSLMGGLELLSLLKNGYKIYPWEPIKYAINAIQSYYFKKVDELNHENKSGGDQDFHFK